MCFFMAELVSDCSELIHYLELRTTEVSYRSSALKFEVITSVGFSPLFNRITKGLLSEYLEKS
jgi:hypothetical protein